MTAQLVTTYYENDHARLDQLFRRFQEFKRRDSREARRCFTQFRVGLQRHIRWEEEILFPVFEQKTGMAGRGPTQVMRMEHRQIETLLESIHERVRHENDGSDEEERLLLDVLSSHNQKEENTLYPAMDRLLAEGEREMIFKTMESIPEAPSAV